MAKVKNSVRSREGSMVDEESNKVKKVIANKVKRKNDQEDDDDIDF